MNTEKPKCGNCGSVLKFRRWSDRLPVKSEALAICTGCGELWQIRYFQGKQTSEPYQVKSKARKTEPINGRAEPNRKAAIIAIYGSIQNFIDTAPLVCIALQLKS